MIRIFYIIIFILSFKSAFIAQIGIDSSRIVSDTLEAPPFVLMENDSIYGDTSPIYSISPDAIEDIILWGARDLEHFDHDNNRMILINEAYIEYGTIKLEAGYMEFDLENGEVLALPLPDSVGNIKQKPKYKDNNDEFEAKKMRYNLKTRKAWIENARKIEGELTVHGIRGKFISKDADTVYNADHMYIEGGIITNCNHEHPHWGIRASKIKLVPNKLAVFGHSMLEIAGVPIYPLTLPFGFYPIFQGQKSGLIIPRNVDIDKDLGIGFKDVGVYFVLSDYMDLRATAHIYTRGTHGVFLSSNYSKRYKYRGTAAISYFNRVTESPFDTSIVRSPSFEIRLSHNQDAKAHPYQSFGGNINLQFANFQKTADKDYFSQTNNIVNSNLSYRRRFPDSPFSMSASFGHSQNLASRSFSVNFPQASVNMNTIYPFKNRNRTGKEKWYERISLKYDARFDNRVTATDTTIYILDTLRRNMNTGFKQALSSGATFSLFKYINLGFNAGYDETHYFKTIDRRFDPTPILKEKGFDSEGNILYDTIYGRIITDTLSEWKVFRRLTPSINLSTNRFGKLMFSSGWLRGIKHKVSYSVSLSGNPFDERKRYIRSVDTDSRPEFNRPREYNIFELGGPTGTVSPSSQNVFISYSINNFIDAKFFSKRDSTTRNVSLLKGLSFSGNYSVFADSLNLSPVRAGFNLPLFNNFIFISYSGQLDFYEKVNNIRLDRYVWEKTRFPVRHDHSTVGITINNRSIEDILNFFIKDKGKQGQDEQSSSTTAPKEERLISIIKDFRLNYNISMRWERNRNNVDTFFVSFHSISINGNIPLTKNWNLRINNFDYNIRDKRFEYPDLSIERDLHCWRMNFSWRPSGGSYTFFLGVKSTTLEFIKYTHGEDPFRSAVGRTGGMF